jgi:hypothetical protein
MKLNFEVLYGHLMISSASEAPLFCHQAITVSGTKCGEGTPAHSDSGTVAVRCTRHARHRAVRLSARGSHTLLYMSFVLPVKYSNMLVRNNVNIRECKQNSMKRDMVRRKCTTAARPAEFTFLDHLKTGITVMKPARGVNQCLHCNVLCCSV